MQGLLHGCVCVCRGCVRGEGGGTTTEPSSRTGRRGHSLEQEGEGTHSPKERKGQPADRAAKLFLKAVGDQAEAG